MKKVKFDADRLEKHERLLKSIVNAIDDMDYMLKEKGLYSWSNENIALDRCKKIVKSLKYQYRVEGGINKHGSSE